MTPCILVEFSSALNMEGVLFCKTLANTYQPTWRHNTQENNIFSPLKQKYHFTVPRKATCPTVRSVPKFRSKFRS